MKNLIYNRLAFLNKYGILSQGSEFYFVEIIVWELTDTSQWRNIKIFCYAQLDNFFHNKAKITIEITWHFSTRSTVLWTIGRVFPGK